MERAGSTSIETRASPDGGRQHDEPIVAQRGPDGAGPARPAITTRARPWLTPMLAIGVALVGLLMSTLVVVILERQQREHLDDSLNQMTDLVSQAVLDETRRYEETLRGLAVSVNAQTDLTEDDYAEITSTLSRDSLRGVAGVSLVVPVAAGKVAEAQRTWRAQGSTGLTLRPIDDGRPEHRFVVFTRNLETQVNILGRQIEAPEALAAMDRALVTGRPTASETFVLLRDKDLPAERHQLSFMISMPVRLGVPTGATRGWLNMSLRGREFLSRTLQQVSQELVDVFLIDQPSGTPGRLVASWPRTDLSLAGSRKKRVVNIPVGQRTWRLEVYPTEKLTQGEVSQLPLIAGGAGLAISVLLAGLVLVLADSRERALAAVRAATSALKADIARREEVERTLRRREADLRGFAGIAAHDLKAPLASASAHLEMLADDGCLDDHARHDIERARASMTRMTRLIADLLSYATADQAELRLAPVDLGEAVSEILRDRESHDGLGGPLIEVGELPTVSGDPIMLRQLLDNLIGNAIKYVAPGSRPEVAVRAIPLAEGGWRIEVADRGIGIPPEHLASIFDAFHRARGAERYQGTGLGLAICKSIACRHGGEIGVRDNPGGGSVFWFTLPIKDHPADQGQMHTV